ncbi:glycine decarboxylase subunit P [Saitoella coloradoensis]
MLKKLGFENFDEFIKTTIPPSVLSSRDLKISEPLSERELHKRLDELADKNKVNRSYIGMGYTGSITPAPITRNILENPAWYTQYTPYQAEISQGRLEGLLNWQTLVSELTGLNISNASLLDEATAAAEGMAMCVSTALPKMKKSDSKKIVFFVDTNCHPQTINVVQARAHDLGVQVRVGDALSDLKDHSQSSSEHLVGVLVQYPDTNGQIIDYTPLKEKLGDKTPLLAATNLLALTVLKPPPASILLGSSQNFGIPMAYGGPHAAFLACSEEYKRRMPGRLVGVSKDTSGRRALRLALQTREQHIRREKATSNICTAQALLANMAAMYAVYHGPMGLKQIAERIRGMTQVLAEGIQKGDVGDVQGNGLFFDTLTIRVKDREALLKKAEEKGINFRIHSTENTVGITLDETVTEADVNDLLRLFGCNQTASEVAKAMNGPEPLPEACQRTGKVLQQPVFNTYHSETELLRYMHHLQSKDLSLTHSMIPLGSCTMKLNATSEMLALSKPEFMNLHPFVPRDQAQGYAELISELEKDLSEITGFDAVSLQPNSGAQGEYAGLRVIRAYLDAQGQGHRDVCLIPVSAHGTNPASAAMCGLRVVPVKCDKDGNLDMSDLASKAEKHKDSLAAFMVTYPSTFGVFEPRVKEACEIIHKNGGQVYMDGANMNAQIGLCSPGEIGADVCHLNLHKTFCIPHGGGGPGVGPIGVKAHLQPYLMEHPIVSTGVGEKGVPPVAAAPWGSAGILPISWSYIKMMGANGLTHATKIALLSANYMAKRLTEHYKILYTNEHGMVAHEFILDVRGFKASAGIEAVDIAKRLQDYGFHAPTMSWPVANTLMIEPTESESLAELDRYCDALIAIREEIAEIERGEQPRDSNLLKNSPHTQRDLLVGEWKNRSYSRERAAYPLAWLQEKKFWPSVGRLDDAYGDLNLFCTCDPVAAEEEGERPYGGVGV